MSDMRNGTKVRSDIVGISLHPTRTCAALLLAVQPSCRPRRGTPPARGSNEGTERGPGSTRTASANHLPDGAVLAEHIFPVGSTSKVVT